MRNPVCLFIAIWRSLRHFNIVSGHAFQTAAFTTPANVHALECKRCGKMSIAWSFDSLEDQK